GRPEADAKGLDVDVAPLGQQEVAQLVDKDHQPQAERDLDDVPVVLGAPAPALEPHEQAAEQQQVPAVADQPGAGPGPRLPRGGRPHTLVVGRETPPGRAARSARPASRASSAAGPAPAPAPGRSARTGSAAACPAATAGPAPTRP